MAILGRAKEKQEVPAPRILDVTAHMQGSLIFQEPVALRISGGFEGTLETRGELTIGEKAIVQADITGDIVTIAGRVTGKMVARRFLKIIAPAVVKGEVFTPSLEVQPGARLEGTLHMTQTQTESVSMTAQEVAEYLEVESRIVEQWAKDKKIPASQEGGQWRFEKTKIDEWVATQKSS